ncbi:MAG: hypothetical protein Q9195_000207 [Heterodermia aff. obscurata]
MQQLSRLIELSKLIYARRSGQSITPEDFESLSKGLEGLLTHHHPQLDVLNTDFGPHGISFKLIETLYHYNDSWATRGYESEMKTAVRRGTYADLNIYYLSDFYATSDRWLGCCTFPGSLSVNSSIMMQDGCVLDTGTLPGGDLAPYNEGVTSTHEVGHWFGLLHVFGNLSCSGDGDYVSDTPQQSVATQGCPSSQDSCPDLEGLDDVRNYMDYSLDGW